MSVELATLDWKEMDQRDPAKYNGGGWVPVEDLDLEIQMDDIDEVDDIDRRHSIVSRKKRKQFTLQT